MFESRTANLSQCLSHHRHRIPDREAVIDGDRRFTYREFDDLVSQTAAAFLSLGLEAGEVVGIVADNSAEHLAQILAANRIGAIPSPINWRLAADELGYILRQSGLTVLSVGERFVETARLAAADAPDLRVVVTDAATPPEGWRRWPDLLDEHRGAEVADVPSGLDDLQRILYTSGTTSRPKGVMLTHGNVLFNTLAQIVELELSARDRIMISAPLFHVSGGDVPGFSALYVGATLVIAQSYQASDIVELIERERVSGLILAAQILNGILQLDVSGRDLTVLRFIVFGGIAPPIYQRLQEHLPHVWLVEAYGMTELCNGGAYLDAAHVPDKVGSMGRPFMHLSVRVIDDDGVDVAPGEIGEMVVQGYKVSPGYWRDPDVTEASRPDGWFRTGDHVRQDADGYLWYMDRAKDMIKSGGENVASAEIERVVLSHPDVAEAAVIGVPDDRWTEVPAAYVVARPGATLSPDDVREFCRERLAKFKVPAHVIVEETLPRNDSGKVLKRVLRERGDIG